MRFIMSGRILAYYQFEGSQVRGGLWRCGNGCRFNSRQIDARANSTLRWSAKRQTPCAKGQYNVMRPSTIPKGTFHPRFANVPDADSLAKKR